jgi:hypothetical protein
MRSQTSPSFQPEPDVDIYQERARLTCEEERSVPPLADSLNCCFVE